MKTPILLATIIAIAWVGNFMDSARFGEKLDVPAVVDYRRQMLDDATALDVIGVTCTTDTDCLVKFGENGGYY